MQNCIATLCCTFLCACSMSVDEMRSHLRVDTLVWEDTTRSDDNGPVATERSVDRSALELAYGGSYLDELEAAQGELHASLGVELPITHGWFTNLSLDYLYPGEPALDEATETIETEFDGWALRFGLGWEF